MGDIALLGFPRSANVWTNDEGLGTTQTIVDVIFAQKRQRFDLRQLQATEKFLHSYDDRY